MNKKIQDMTRDEFSELVKDCMLDILVENKLLKEMASSRSDYISKCLDRVEVFYTHLAKICLSELEYCNKQAVNHWKVKLIAPILFLTRLKIKNDDSTQSKKKRAFVEGFIEGPLGKNFEDYDDISCYFYNALEDEGFTEEQIETIDIIGIISQFKDRITSFLLTLFPLVATTGTKEHVRSEIRKVIDKF